MEIINKMTHGSLFSGIGGFDLAAEWMGWENIFHCEWNEFGQKVLKHYWPNAKSYHDITKTDFTIHRGTIDILTGGFPCQPYSMAGKRKGKEDERHLWPEMLRTIREVQPRWVVGENVFGLVNWSGGLVFHEVQADLEAAGYEVWPYVLPAAAVNAPHRRDRVWFVAKNTKCNGLVFGESNQEGAEIREFRNTCTGSSIGVYLSEGPTPHPNGNGFNQCNGNDENEYGDAADTGHTGLQGSQINGSIGGSRQESDKLTTGCVRSNWQNFPTQSPICTGNDGLSPRLDGITFPKWRKESIKAGGNAIVPQVALQIFKAIEQYEQTPA
jgi:DNA (cytosine-5)-methyltransferase 1